MRDAAGRHGDGKICIVLDGKMGTLVRGGVILSVGFLARSSRLRTVLDHVLTNYVSIKDQVYCNMSPVPIVSYISGGVPPKEDVEARFRRRSSPQRHGIHRSVPSVLRGHRLKLTM